MRPFIRPCYHDPLSNVVHLFLIIQTRRTITMISRADAHRAAIHLRLILGFGVLAEECDHRTHV